MIALKFIHGKYTHRDIKPENLMIGNDGNVRIIDFGLSKECNQTTTNCGTDFYVAPEVYTKIYDEKVDSYSLAVTIYKLLTGSEIFDTKTIKTKK